ncbi:3',5'-cyclic-nucleotide phosphodiesterase [Silvimonas sp. JCM 19000]
MQLQVLGCSGGIGAGQRTTSLLLDDRILIDAGTGVGDLSFEALLQIDHIFLTHAHMDHIACLPMLLDTAFGSREQPVTVHATQAAIDVLQRHIFNWQIWPDFAAIPSPQAPFLRFAVMEQGDSVEVPGGRIRALPALHTVPAVAYALHSADGCVVFSGDTADHPPFWQAVNQIADLRALIIETAFADQDADLARTALHFSPSALLTALGQMQHEADVWITHLKPADHELIMQQLQHDPVCGRRFARLLPRQRLDF